MTFKILLLDFTREQLQDLMTSWGEPPYRGNQVYEWLHKNLVTDPMQMTNLPKRLRERLAAESVVNPLERIVQVDDAHGETRKTLFRLPDGATIEVVLMLYDKRRTVCISTQVGCGIGCPFCATGMGGLTRNLSPGEIIAQVHWFERWLREDAPDSEGLAVQRPSRVTNIVIMGMGEPLANYDATMQALRAIADPKTFALSARNITLSTVGLVPKIDRLAEEESLPIRLAVSLHAPTDRLRNKLVPINQRYHLPKLIDALVRYQEKTRRRVTFEYAMMRGINDSVEQAHLLVDLLTPVRKAHVNLIPLNPTPGSPYQPSSPEAVRRFQQVLEAGGVTTTVRLRRGVEISAGCGQLRQAAQQPDVLQFIRA
ncbi:MAG TPA: 23S rRNA (adenine(2503)-C(2))-methyltransferase RlmN [Anaerolineae bacterium]|nr:23S rRNA (adenine(2503)-C(2))-methyltransferase RlmN [Anaerolineae bacterium]